MSKFYVPINLDIEVHAENANEAWEMVYTKLNVHIRSLVSEHFPDQDLHLEIGEPDEVFE